MKRKLISRKSGAAPACSVTATALFLLLAAGIVLLCVLGLFRFAQSEAAPPADAAAGGESAAPTAQPPEAEPGSEAAYILTPPPEHTPDPDKTPGPDGVSDADAPEASPTPTPTPAPMQPVSARAFSSKAMDLAILGFNEQNHADVLCILALREKSCTVLSLPNNTLYGASGATLADATEARQALSRIAIAYPVQLTHYIRLDMAGLPACVDAFGGVNVGGVFYDGAGVSAYLDAGGSDELLRITRQQALLRALIEKLRSVSLLRLLSAKHTTQKYAESSLTANQYIELYNALRGLDPDAIRFLTLPVDSRTQDGIRRYAPDHALCEALVREIYGS